MKLKKIFMIMCLSLTIFSIFNCIYAEISNNLGKGFDSSLVPSGGTSAFQTQTNRIWNTFVTVVRIAAFIGIFIIGLRYMFASSNQKAEIKKSSIALVVGIALVFTSTVVIDFVVALFNELK